MNTVKKNSLITNVLISHCTQDSYTTNIIYKEFSRDETSLAPLLFNHITLTK